jgi:hypothetical protein
VSPWQGVGRRREQVVWAFFEAAQKDSQAGNWCGCGTSKRVAFARRRCPSQRFARPDRGCVVRTPYVSRQHPHGLPPPPLPDRLSSSPPAIFAISAICFRLAQRKELVVVESQYGEGRSFCFWESKTGRSANGCDRGGRRRGGVKIRRLQLRICIQCQSRPGMPGVVLHGSCGERKVR